MLTDEVKIQWITTDSCFLHRKKTYNESCDSVVPRLGPDWGDDFLWLLWLTFVCIVDAQYVDADPMCCRKCGVRRKIMTLTLCFFQHCRYDWCVRSRYNAKRTAAHFIANVYYEFWENMADKVFIFHWTNRTDCQALYSFLNSFFLKSIYKIGRRQRKTKENQHSTQNMVIWRSE